MSILSSVIDNDDMKKIINEFSRLKDKCYLESAGALLYPQNLIHTVKDDLLNNVYMNPHTDKYTRDCIEHIRSLILTHFNTDLTNYAVIFTSGATQSLKIVVESFRFGAINKESKVVKQGSFVYLMDNHTSVLGLREIAVDKSADIIPIAHLDFLAAVEIDTDDTTNVILRHEEESNTLLAYPAQSNFNGFKYPINCINTIKEGCLNVMIEKMWKPLHNWYVLLDAATFVGTSQLDLSKTQPDFVCFSFYKMFGYPSGLGALLVKKSSADVLNDKHYFGGGTVDIVLSNEDYHVKRSNIQERFEDGTVSFLSIIDLKHCFDTMHNMIPKTINNNLMDTISHHTFSLAKDLYEQLDHLYHNNRTKAAVLYMDSDFSDMQKQGGIVAFNIVRADGSYIGYSEFQHMADLFGICVRTGCFCNSGSCQRHFKKTNSELKKAFEGGHVCGDDIDLLNGEPTGGIRASFAYYNTFNDVDKLISMICRCFVSTIPITPQRTMTASRTVPDMRFLNTIKRPKPIYREVNRNSTSSYISKTMPKIMLTEIALFPIKSCGAMKIRTAWPIGPKGLLYDREWMIVNHNGVCLTQKLSTRMCMIQPTIDLNRNVLILNFEGQAPISIPLIIPVQNERISQICQSKICSDMIKGYDCGDEVGQWISEALEMSFLRLVRQSNEDQRMAKTKNNKFQNRLSLSNQAQFLLINKATVRWLKNKITDGTFVDSVDQLTDRFRGNLIIDTHQELVEKEWQGVIIGDHEFNVEGPCSRCQMVCIDQRNGEKTVEPLRTIAETFEGKLRFGIYLSYVGSVGSAKEQYLEINAAVLPMTVNDVTNTRATILRYSSVRKKKNDEEKKKNKFKDSALLKACFKV